MKTQGHDTNVVFLSGVRTGFGSFGGTLKDLSAIQLGTEAAKHALERAGVEPGDVDHVVFGNALQTSADAIYLARHVGLHAGLPIETPAVTVNRLCGSGFDESLAMLKACGTRYLPRDIGCTWQQVRATLEKIPEHHRLQGGGETIVDDGPMDDAAFDAMVKRIEE